MHLLLLSNAFDVPAVINTMSLFVRFKVAVLNLHVPSSITAETVDFFNGGYLVQSLYIGNVLFMLIYISCHFSVLINVHCLSL